MSRYIFEHLFIGSLYFDEEGDAASHLVQPGALAHAEGQPIDVIATRRPYDDRGGERFYYRLQPGTVTRSAKRHMPYALNPARMARWRELFLDPDYTVNTLPGYEGKAAPTPLSPLSNCR
jgi:hypothetical protein